MTRILPLPTLHYRQTVPQDGRAGATSHRGALFCKLQEKGWRKFSSSFRSNIETEKSGTKYTQQPPGSVSANAEIRDNSSVCRKSTDATGYCLLYF